MGSVDIMPFDTAGVSQEFCVLRPMPLPAPLQRFILSVLLLRNLGGCRFIGAPLSWLELAMLPSIVLALVQSKSQRKWLTIEQNLEKQLFEVLLPEPPSKQGHWPFRLRILGLVVQNQIAILNIEKVDLELSADIKVIRKRSESNCLLYQLSEFWGARSSKGSTKLYTLTYHYVPQDSCHSEHTYCIW